MNFASELDITKLCFFVSVIWESVTARVLAVLKKIF